MSGLYLDTDARYWIGAIVLPLAESPYSLEELRRILDNEVAPVLHGNLLSAAGEWAGFDEDWLAEQASHRIGKRRWLPCAGQADEWWSALAPLTERLRALPGGEPRAERASLWTAVAPLVIEKGGRPRAALEGRSVDEVEAGFRELAAVMPWRIDAAEAEENWSAWVSSLST